MLELISPPAATLPASTLSSPRCPIQAMADQQQSKIDRNGLSTAILPNNTPSAATPTAIRLPSMRDLLQHIKPATSISDPTRHGIHHQDPSHRFQRPLCCDRSTIERMPPSPDDSSSMALDDYADDMPVVRAPSGPGRKSVETWARTQSIGNGGLHHAISTHPTSHGSSSRRTSNDSDVGRDETSRNSCEMAAAQEWTSIASLKRNETFSGASQHQDVTSHQQNHSLSSPRLVDSSSGLASPSNNSFRLATSGAPFYPSQTQTPVRSHPNESSVSVLSDSRERAFTMNHGRPEDTQGDSSPRFFPLHPPGYTPPQSQSAAHPGHVQGSGESYESVSSAATGRSSLLPNQGDGLGRQWEESRSRSDSLHSLTTNRSSFSATSRSPGNGYYQSADARSKGYFPSHVQSANNHPLLFAPLSPQDSQPPLSAQVGTKNYPTVLSSSHASRMENGHHHLSSGSSGSSGSYPPSPVSPIFVDGKAVYSTMPVAASHSSIHHEARRSWDQDSLRTLVSPSGPHPQLPSIIGGHTWTSQSPITPAVGFPSPLSGPTNLPTEPQAPYSAGRVPLGASLGSRPSPPVPTLSLPPAPERLAHTRRRRKPPASYAYLITQAISSSATGQMSLKEIYFWISQAHPTHYSLDGPDSQSWTNVIRHNLSLNKAFVKVPKHEESGPVKSGKGGLWTLDRNIIEQRANSGPGATGGLSAALAAGDAMREARAQGRDLPIASGVSQDNDDRMSVDEPPSSRCPGHNLPFPIGLESESSDTANESFVPATQKNFKTGDEFPRRRSKSHFESQSYPRDPRSLLGTPTQPSRPSGIVTSLHQSAPAAASSPSTNRPIAGRPRGRTISNGDIGKQRHPNVPSLPYNAVLQSPSKRKLVEGVNHANEGEPYSARSIKIRSHSYRSPQPASSPLSSEFPLASSRTLSTSYSPTRHDHSGSRVNINQSLHRRQDDTEDDEAEFRRLYKSPKLSADLQSLGVEDKDEEQRFRDSNTPTQGSSREGQSMKIAGLLC